MVTSCPQNNNLSSDMPSHYHLSTPNRTGNRESAQTVAPSTPRMIKTPVPRMPSSARRLLTPQNAPRDDLDRFIPSRRRMNIDLCRRKLKSASKPRESSSVASTGPTTVARSTQIAYEKQLLSTMCNVDPNSLNDESQLKSIFQYGSRSPPKPGNRRSVVAADPFELDFLRFSTMCQGPKVSTAAPRVFGSQPVMILDLPSLVNDFYTHPVSWSKDNMLAVVLGSSVYVMNETTRAVQEIAGAGSTPNAGDGTRNYVRCVKWCTVEGQTHLLAVGTGAGVVRVYDTIRNQEVMQTSLRSEGSALRALCWNDSHKWLTAGYANGGIASLDLRSRSVTGTTQFGSSSSIASSAPSVCNLAWNEEGTCLASGRNDNAIHLWDASMMRGVTSGPGPRLVLESHNAAVKGLAWCPYRSDLLASGGGTADRCIKLWDACSGSVVKSVLTGGQVSSLHWGRHHQELYSGHGFSVGTSISDVAVWSYPKMELIQTLSQHNDRILCMDMSPDGSKLASVGADEILCIWKVDAAPAPARSRSIAEAVFGSPSFGPRYGIR